MTTDPDPPDPVKTELDKILETSKKNTSKSEIEAIACFEKVILTKNPDKEQKSRAYELLGCSYLKLGNYYAALQAFDNAIAANSENTFARIQKGRCLMKVRQNGAARRIFEEVLDTLNQKPVESDPSVSDRQKPDTTGSKSPGILSFYLSAYLSIGIILSKMYYYQEAVEYFREAEDYYEKFIRDHPEIEKDVPGLEKCKRVLFMLQVSRCCSAHRSGMSEQARDELHRIIRTLRDCGDDATWRQNLIGAYIVLGTVYVEGFIEDTAAEAQLDIAIDEVKHLAPLLQQRYIWKVYRNKGQYLKKQKKFPEAIACYSEGIARYSNNFPGNTESRLVYERGITYTEMRKFDDGIRDLRLLQKYDPRYELVDIALAENYHRRAMHTQELEFQQQLLDKFTTTVKKTEDDLTELSKEMTKSLKGVQYLFYFIFCFGVFLFILALYFTIGNALTGKQDLAAPIIALVGGIDVILSMIFLSPTKIQKNRIDYSQWLMGYYNWLNTEFVAGVVLSERLMKIHAPDNTGNETIEWADTESMHKFLHSMTKEMMETIDKCCEFPDVPYSLSKKTDTTTAAKKTDDGKTDQTTTNGVSDSTGKKTAEKIEEKTLTVPAETEKTGAAPKTNFPGTILPGFSRDDVPAIILGIWQGNLVDETCGSNATGTVIGTKPEPVDKIPVKEITDGKKIYYTLKGYKSMSIVLGISYFYVDENQRYSYAPDPDDPKFSLYTLKRNNVTLERYRIESESPGNTVHHVDAGKIMDPHYFELPRTPMDKETGVHFIRFRIAEGRFDKQKKNPTWIWESGMFEYTVTE